MLPTKPGGGQWPLSVGSDAFSAAVADFVAASKRLMSLTRLRRPVGCNTVRVRHKCLIFFNFLRPLVWEACLWFGTRYAAFLGSSTWTFQMRVHALPVGADALHHMQHAVDVDTGHAPVQDSQSKVFHHDAPVVKVPSGTQGDHLRGRHHDDDGRGLEGSSNRCRFGPSYRSCCNAAQGHTSLRKT